MCFRGALKVHRHRLAEPYRCATRRLLRARPVRELWPLRRRPVSETSTGLKNRSWTGCARRDRGHGCGGSLTAADASRGAARASDTALNQVRHATRAPQATQTLAASRWSPRAARARPYALASSRPARYSRLTRRPCLAPAETAGPLPAGGWCAAAAPRTSEGCRSLRVPERATTERATAERSPDGRTDRPALCKRGCVCLHRPWWARHAWARPSEQVA